MNVIQASARMRRSVLRALAWFGLAFAVSTVSAQVPSNPYSYGRTSSFTYFGAADGAKNGLLKSETVEPDNVQLCVTTSYDYDSQGNKTTATTANCAGASGRAVFDARTTTSNYGAATFQIGAVGVPVPAGLFATQITNALSQSENRTYDPRYGTVTQLTGPNGLTTTWTLDAFGRKVQELHADGTSSLIAYCMLADTGSNSDTQKGDPLGCPTPSASEIPPNAVSFVHTESRAPGGTTRNTPFVRVYADAMGRNIRTVTEAFDGAGQRAGYAAALIVKDTVYNAYGAKIVETQPYFLSTVSSTTTGSNDIGAVLTDYDALGRPTAVYTADATGHLSRTFDRFGDMKATVQTIAYSGLSTKTTNDRGQARQEERNLIGEVVRATDASGAQIAYQRDAFGNLVATRDPLGNQLTATYDVRGRKLSMVDPDTGTWKYDYDALGQLVWQQSANQLAAGSETSMTYDKLGRLKTRLDPEYGSTWYYDRNADNSYCMQGDPQSIPTLGAGKLCEIVTTHGIDRKYYYDQLGRSTNARTDISGGPNFSRPSTATAVTYDGSGRLASQTYPTGLQVGYGYTPLGFLEKLTLLTPATVTPLPDANGQTTPGTSLPKDFVLWQAQVVNAWGKTEQQSVGNGVLSTAQYDPQVGRVTDLFAGVGGGTGVLNQHYTWDSLGNLTGRDDHNGDGSGNAVSETFKYFDESAVQQSVNRLIQYTVSGAGVPGLTRTVNLQYNALGMLLYKSDVGNYVYAAQGGARPHAVQSVAGAVNANYGYDANGNIANASGGKYRSINYTSFNLPDSQNGMAGPSGGPRYTWQYDETHARVMEVRVDASGTRTTWYMHPDNQGGLGFESETAPNGVISNRHYLSAGGQAIGVLVSTGALSAPAAGQMSPPSISSIGLVKVEYWHKDHLGSLVATTDHNHNVTQRYAYDPFGKRRFTNGSYDEFGNVVADWSPSLNAGTDRGFTGHEHLDDIGVVNMNGRIFDPTLGVFLQGDPMIQDPDDLQNYNRYGYCFNNPMGCTDPSGFFSWRTVLSPNRLWMRKVSFQRAQNINAVTCGLAPSYWQALCNAGSTYDNYQVHGYSGWDAYDRATEVFAISVFSIAVNKEIGGTWASSQIATITTEKQLVSTLENWLAHGVWGCIEARAYGGNCASGFRGGFASAAMSSVWKYKSDNKYFERAVNTMIHAGLGGLAAKAGGGNFADGARSASFAYLFNCIPHHCDEAPAAPSGVPIIKIGDPEPVLDILRMIRDFFAGDVDESRAYRERALKAADLTADQAKGLEVHHVVLRDAAAAAPARVALATVGIGVDDLENLLILPASDHRVIHDGPYITAVNAAMTATAPLGRTAVLEQLTLIKTSLVTKGRYP